MKLHILPQTRPFLASAAIAVFASTAAAQPPHHLLTADYTMPLRVAPDVTADQVVSLPIGCTLRVEADTTDASGTTWHEVVLAHNDRIRVGIHHVVRGWVTGDLLPVDVAQPAPALRRLVGAVLARGQNDPGFEGLRFEKLVELENAVLLQMERSDDPELRVLHFAVLERAGRRLSTRSFPDPLRESWIYARRNLIRYYEPAGEWMVEPEAWWDLYEAHADHPSAEILAWRASRTRPSDGGGTSLILQVAIDSFGRYLSLYPAGRHIGDVVNRMDRLVGGAVDEACENTGPFPSPEATRHEVERVGQQIAEIRRLLEPVEAEITDPLLEHLAEIERKCEQRRQ